MSEKVEEIVEKLKFLTLLEASTLVKKIEETFNVDVSTSMSASANFITPSGPKAEEVAIEEKTEFDVLINEVPSGKRITVIKVLRTLASYGLKEAKDLIESVPKVVLEAVTKDKAEEAKKLLEEAGAAVIIK